MSNSQINNLASEIILAKTAASSATTKITKLLNEVQILKSYNLDISSTIYTLNNKVNNINDVIDNIDNNSDLNDLLNQINDISGQVYTLVNNINNLDTSFVSELSFNNLSNVISYRFDNIDISLTNLIQDVGDICGSGFLEKIRNISGDVLQLESVVTNVSGQLFNLVDVVNNLDISYLTDLSFVEFVNNINNLDTSFVSELSFNNLSNTVNTNLPFLSNQDVLLKSDINYSNTLIDINNVYIRNIERKFNNLVNIINSQLNLNINIHTL